MELVGLIFIIFLRYWFAGHAEGHKRDDFVVDTLFYFEPVRRFEYRGDMFSFRGSNCCVSEGVVQ